MWGNCGRKSSRAPRLVQSEHRRPSGHDIWAGLLAPGSLYSPRLPEHDTQWRMRLLSPVTAAGPRRIHTVFPILSHRQQVSRAPMSAWHRTEHGKEFNRSPSDVPKSFRWQGPQFGVSGPRPPPTLRVYPASLRSWLNSVQCFSQRLDPIAFAVKSIHMALVLVVKRIVTFI